MIKKLTKHGEDYLLVFDEAECKALNITENTFYTETCENDKIIITFVESPSKLKNHDTNNNI